MFILIDFERIKFINTNCNTMCSNVDVLMKTLGRKVGVVFAWNVESFPKSRYFYLLFV